MMWHGYFIIDRIVANLGETNWMDLIELVRQIQTNGDRAEYKLREVGSLDTFEEIIDPETILDWSNSYIYEARYADGAVSFDKFALKLADAFGVDVDDITITTGGLDGTVFATYKYGASNRFRLGLFGCLTDNNLCSWQESGDAARELLSGNVDWEAIS